MTTQNTNGKQDPPTSQALQRIQTLEQVLSEDFVQNQLAAALGGDNAPGFRASLIELFTGDKYLQECDPRQLVLQALKAAALRLPINKTLGFAWLISYNKIPTFQIGYKGLIQLGIRSGSYKTLNADVVYEGEIRNVDKISGTFDLNGKATSEKVIGYFAYMELKNGFSKMLYSTVEQITAHAKKYSKSWGKAGSGWATDFDAMGKKTLIRNLLTHWGILSVEMVTAIENDIDFDAADKVMDEIKGKGNSQSMGFTDAEVIPPNDQNQDPGPNWG
jgi:recombination protein RecT